MQEKFDTIKGASSAAKVYPVNRGDNLKWAVQRPENKGTDKVLGDTLHATKEDAEKYANIVARQEADRLKRNEIEKKQKDVIESEKVKYINDDINGFVANKTSLNKGSIKKALSKKYRFSNGEIMSIRDRIESLHNNGELKTSTYETSKIKPMSRTVFNRASNKEQSDHEQKMKEAGNKTVYLVNGSELGKIAYDYATHLQTTHHGIQIDR